MCTQEHEKAVAGEVCDMYWIMWEEPYGPPKRIRYDEEERKQGKIVRASGLTVRRASAGHDAPVGAHRGARVGWDAVRASFSDSARGQKGKS